jgi:hypothetical protein
MSQGEEKVAKKGGGGQSHATPKPKLADDDKARRQAEALRANLKRRKTQQRDRADSAKVASDGE